MTRPPDFDDLVEGVDTVEERDRLRRVHDLLVAAGPPPELSPALAASPEAPIEDEEEPDVAWMPPRRLGAGLLVGFAALAAAFGAGYFAGDRGSDSTPVPAAAPATTRVVSLRESEESDAVATIRLGRRNASGNWPMVVSVRGLPQLSRGDYYTLALLKDGKPVVTCGTFNVADEGLTTVPMVAAYDLNAFDGWVITRYNQATHAERIVMRESV